MECRGDFGPIDEIDEIKTNFDCTLRCAGTSHFDDIVESMR